MLILYPSVTLRAPLLLKENIDALLRRRGYRRKDLAQWCHRTEGWLSKIFRESERGVPLKYLDRMADFFGLTTYQLFQPGIARSSERRRGLERRSSVERRISRRIEDMEARAPEPIQPPQITTDVLVEMSRMAARLTELAQAAARQHAGNDPIHKPRKKASGK